MGKYTVEHSCGHTQVHALFGPPDEQTRKITWLETKPCTNCDQEQRAQERATATAAAVEAAQAQGLPALTGTEKQIAWAETIRRGVLSHLDAALTELLEAHDNLDPAAQRELADAFALLQSEFAARTEARWWLDHKDEYDWSSVRCMRHWAWEQAQARGLIPAYEQVRQARAEAGTRRDERRRTLLLAIRLEPETLRWDDAGTRIMAVQDSDLRMTRTGTDRFALADAAGELGTLNLYAAEAADLAGRLNTLETEAERRQAAEQRSRRHDSLRGVTVVAAQATRKRSSNLTVTLSNGRAATGHHTARATEITAVAGQPVTPDHPEVQRLAAAARQVVVRV